MKLEITTTEYGFELVDFTDHYGVPCTLQQSAEIDDTERGPSNPGSSHLWLGTDSMHIRRMHLSREHVAELVSVMTRWLETGRLSE